MKKFQDIEDILTLPKKTSVEIRILLSFYMFKFYMLKFFYVSARLSLENEIKLPLDFVLRKKVRTDISEGKEMTFVAPIGETTRD